jgi:hypothetical protein
MTAFGKARKSYFMLGEGVSRSIDPNSRERGDPWRQI